MLTQLANFIVDLVWDLWYLWIYIMMCIESSFIPFPSEVVMIPAWALVSKWEMNFYIVLAVWTFWALTWALVNYFLGYYLWAPVIKTLIKKYWKYFLLNEEKYLKAECFFNKYWSITTFIWRLITVIRQLISIPAWVFKMNILTFCIYTILWAWIWNFILIVIWYIAWENKELIEKYQSEITIWIFLFIIILIAFYILKNKKSTKK